MSFAGLFPKARQSNPATESGDMLKSLDFENYRGFRKLKIDPLKRVNLITGENDTGKTAVLEGLCILLASDICGKSKDFLRHLGAVTVRRRTTCVPSGNGHFMRETQVLPR